MYNVFYLELNIKYYKITKTCNIERISKEGVAGVVSRWAETQDSRIEATGRRKTRKGTFYGWYLNRAFVGSKGKGASSAADFDC
jgi:hypothetical protein